MEYLELARKYVEDRFGADADAQTIDVLDRWESVLTRLEHDPMLCAASSTGSPSWSCWRATATATASTGTTPSCSWSTSSTPTCAPTRASTTAWSSPGRIERLLDDDTIERAMHAPPEDTRAYFRGRCLEQYADDVAAASWDSVIFDLPGRDSLQRVPTLEPLRGTKAHVDELLDRCATAEELFRALTHGA